VNVSQNAVKATAALAKGLRKEFEPFARELAPLLIPKFKEKRLVEDVSQALEAISACLTLEDLQAELLTGLSNTAPTVKKCSA